MVIRTGARSPVSQSRNGYRVFPTVVSGADGESAFSTMSTSVLRRVPAGVAPLAVDPEQVLRDHDRLRKPYSIGLRWEISLP